MPQPSRVLDDVSLVLTVWKRLMAIRAHASQGWANELRITECLGFFLRRVVAREITQLLRRPLSLCHLLRAGGSRQKIHVKESWSLHAPTA
jgi:hypothetical protein